MMDESKVAAKVVALREAGYDVMSPGKAPRCGSWPRRARPKGRLQAGDVIVAADGEPVATSTDLIALLQSGAQGTRRAWRSGERGRVKGRRAQGAQTLTVDVPLGESPTSRGGPGSGSSSTYLYDTACRESWISRRGTWEGPAGA